jgi:hypothetical protein
VLVSEARASLSGLTQTWVTSKNWRRHKQCFGWVEEFPYVSEVACSLIVRKEAVKDVRRILVCIPVKGSVSAGDYLLRCKKGTFEF